MEQTTKEKILDAALVSFAENGYRGSSLRNLAADMGLSKSALYKHYTSKEDIWNAVIDRMEAYYEQGFGSPRMLPPIPQSIDELKALTMRLLDFTLHDEKIILTRKLLLTEQFRNERVRKLATEHFMNETKAIFCRIFEAMIENGLLRQEEPELLAFAYTAPITALVHYCDREPEREPEIMRQVGAFLEHFIRVYKACDKEDGGQAE